MKTVNQYLPTRLIFGPGTIEMAGRYAAEIGQYCLIVTGQSSAKRHGHLKKLTDSLEEYGVNWQVYPGIMPNPIYQKVDEAAEIIREGDDKKIDFIIGLGGGSVMDSAKGIAAMARMKGSIWDYIFTGKGKVPKITDALPVMEIPTLAATGSEANKYGVLTNPETKEKCSFNSEVLYPKVSIIDPELTLTVPPGPTADGGVDILSHLLESYLTTNEPDTVISDGITESLVRDVIHYLPEALEDGSNMVARSALSWASTLALSGIPSAAHGGLFILHKIEHALSGYYDITHGTGLAAIFLPYLNTLLRFNSSRVARLARNVFSVSTSHIEAEAKEGIKAFREFLHSVGREVRLSDLGITPSEADIEKMAEMAVRIGGNERGYLLWPDFHVGVVKEIIRKAR